MNRAYRSVDGQHQRQQSLEPVVGLAMEQVAKAYIRGDKERATGNLSWPATRDEWLGNRIGLMKDVRVLPQRPLREDAVREERTGLNPDERNVRGIEEPM